MRQTQKEVTPSASFSRRLEEDTSRKFMSNTHYQPNAASSDAIMIIDDDPEQARRLEQLLKKLYKRLILIEDTRQALSYLLRNAFLPRLIILELLMPKMDGLALLKRLKSTPELQAIPVIIKTRSGADSQTIVACLDAGAVDFIEMPLSPPVFQAKVRAALRVGHRTCSVFNFSTLTQLSQTIGQLWDADNILQQTLDGLFQALPLVSGRIFTVSSDERSLHLKAARGLNAEDKTKTRLIAPDSDIAGQTAFSRQTIIKENGIVSIPLSIMHRVIGVMQFQSAKDYQLTSDEIALLEIIAAQVAAKMENLLFQESVEQTQREVVKIHHANRALNQATTPEAIYQALISYAASSSLDIISLWLFPAPHRRGEPLPTQAEVVDHWQSDQISPSLAKKTLDLTTLNLHHALRRTEPLLSSNIAGDETLPPAMKTFLQEQLGLQTAAFVPMLAQETWVGVLLLGSKIGNPQRLSPEMLRSYWLLTGQAATAIVNLRLFQNAQRQAAELRVIDEMSRVFASSLDLQQVLESIIGQVSSVLQANACSVFLVDPKNNDLLLGAALDATNIPPEFKRLPAGQGIVGWVVEHAQAQLVPDVSKDSRYFAKVGQVTNLDAGSIICAPITREENILGAIQAINKETNAFTQEDLRLLTAAANHAAIAIDNARLHKETLQRLAELGLLQKAGAKLTATIEMDALLEVVVSSAIALLNADSGSILLFKKNSRTEARRMAISIHQKLSHSDTSIRPDGITSQIIETGNILTVPDISQANSLSNYVLQQDWQAFMGVPLKTGARTLGVLYINYTSPQHFSQHDLTLLETFINQAILAIEHVSHYQETQENLRRISVLYEIAQTARDIRDRDRVLKFVAVTVHRYFHAAGVSFLELADNGDFSLLYTTNLSKKEVLAYQKHPWRITETLFSPLLKGNSIQIPHLQTKEYAKFQKRLLYPATAASWYAIPLLIKNKLQGIMVLSGQKPDAVHQDDLQFLYTIAGHVAVTLENISLVNALEKQTQALREANLQLVEANKVKSRFLATVSHELRTPMNSIIGYSEILQDELDGPLTADQADSVERILRSGRNLLSLINDVLDYSRIEAGKITIHPISFVVSEALDDALKVILPLAKQKNLTITSDISDPLLTAYADPDRTRQILLNILANAIKFTETGSIHIKIEAKENQALISITDTGIGILPEDLPHLFEEFHQIDSSMSRKFGGTGLGLAISKQLLTLMNGTVEVESRIGEGSTFTIMLPRSENSG